MTVTASRFDAALEGLANRTASLVPKRHLFTANGTWTKPLNCLLVDIFVIGDGMQGGSCTYPNAGAGGGGASGVWTRMRFRTEQVPSSLTVVASGGTYTVSGDSGNFSVNPEAGLTPNAPGNGGVTSAGTRGSYTADNDGDDAHWGAGGAGGGVFVNGSIGRPGYGGAPGAGGARGGETPGAGGRGGRGYGAGGGGAGGSIDSSGGGGGGGGGGGYGYDALAAAGASGRTSAGTALGGNGAPGCVEITAWCGVEVA